jgi:hypothetical protein
MRPDERTNDARTTLQAWYLHALQPKLARAANRGAVDPRSVVAFDDELRALLGISRAQDEAA